jgi:D-psicose/D-tagatose/L-ribulose 3-epimerase
MKIGINLWNWTKDPCKDLAGLVLHVAFLGFGAVELPLNRVSEWDYSGIAKSLRKTGLELTLCAQLSNGLDGSSLDEGTRQQTIQYLQNGLEVGAKLGAKVLAGPLYGGSGKRHFLPPKEKAAELRRAADTLSILCHQAEQVGVKLALEPVNRYRTSVVNTAAQAMDLVNQIGSSALGILFDSYQANIEESDPIAALESILTAGKLFHFHACENHRGAPGSGHIDWKSYLKALKAGGYTGHLTMETFTPGGLDSGFLETAEPDEVATFGLNYLTGLLMAGI